MSAAAEDDRSADQTGVKTDLGGQKFHPRIMLKLAFSKHASHEVELRYVRRAVITSPFPDSQCYSRQIARHEQRKGDAGQRQELVKKEGHGPNEGNPTHKQGPKSFPP